jgi:NADH dehydrogenase (ubiquinone) Fe-S protein 5
VNTNEDNVSGAKKCTPALEDYYECLHHRKEVCPWFYLEIIFLVVDTCILIVNVQAARVQALQTAYRKSVAAHPREHLVTADQIRSLGLLDKDEESRAFLENLRKEKESK